MLRVSVVICLVGLAIASPPLVRTREEIQEFRRALESTKTDDGQFLARTHSSPLANPEENSGKFEGDIILDDWMIDGMIQEYAQGRNAYIVPNTHWPDNTVVYEFGPGEFGPIQQQAILDGIADIERNSDSCVKFRLREPGDTAFVRLTGGSGGCYANVGYWASRGVHTLNLARNVPGEGCFRHTTIVHEWLHILGFLHMQSTYNRDDYVQIVVENIIPSTMNNFQIYSSDLVHNMGQDYDYVSCMHYGPFAFTANGLPTIVALQEHEGEMGQRIFVSESDWTRLRRHYFCPGAWDDRKLIQG